MNVVASMAITLSRILKRRRQRRADRNAIALLAARGNEHLLKDAGISREEALELCRRLR